MAVMITKTRFFTSNFANFYPNAILFSGVSCSHRKERIDTRFQKRSYASVKNLNSDEHCYDVIVVGGGIVGMATAREMVSRHTGLKFAVVEKENKLAAHQSGRNSGVIHGGIYYTPGSLMAKLCVEGLELTYNYCDENKVPYKKCGKLIVATSPEELPRLDNLYNRGLKNNVRDLRMVGPEEIREIEPNCRGLKALHSPHTGIVDWGLVTQSYGNNFKDAGGDIYLNYQVADFKMTSSPEYPVDVVGTKPNQRISCKYALTCGGLYADRLAEKSGCNPEPKIVPFRGEYLLLKKEKCNLVNGNIYPVPNPQFPFLGVHFTPRMDGNVWLGPNAVLAFRREGYRLADFKLGEFIDALCYSGFRKLAFKHLSFGMDEMYRSLDLKAQVKLLQRFVPSLKVEDVTRGPTGVRAQALDRDGNLVSDFVFDGGVGELGSRMLHVRNAPSPGATSSLAVAKLVADEAKKRFKL